MYAVLLVSCAPSASVQDAPATSSDGADVAVAAFSPAARYASRLTREQYYRAVEVALDVPLQPTLGPDINANHTGFFSVESASVPAPLTDVELYGEAAYTIATRFVQADENRRDRVPCDPSGAGQRDCFDALARALGRSLFRRDLTDPEVEQHLAIAERAVELTGDGFEGVRYLVAMLLQSPHFLYRIEVGEPAGEDRLRYTSVEMATRLSSFLWDEMPDAALLDEAYEGGLVDDDRLADVVDMMLLDERTRRGVRRFFRELLELDELGVALDAKDPEVFGVLGGLEASALAETYHVIEHNVFEARGDIRDIVSTQETFIDRKLASVYRVPAPLGVGFGAFEFPRDARRSGILTHVSLLALHSRADRSSATFRGLFVRDRLLCDGVPEAPPDVALDLPESEDAPTARERLREHRENPICASCHEHTDPIGLALENFDAVGQFRTEERGATIDPSGDLDGEAFADASELGELIREHPNFSRCLTQRVYEVATGHFVESQERRQLEAIEDTFARNGYQFIELMRAVVLSDGFRMASTETGVE